jgi:cholesterol oxidase
VDHKCRVFDASPSVGTAAVHDGLYVIDGAVMPRSLGVNPLLTITALAERAMLHFAADFSLTFDDAARHYALPIAVGAPGVATLEEER